MSPCSFCGWLLMDPGLFSLVQASIGCCDFRCLWLCHAQKMAFHNPFLFLPSLRCFHSLFCYVPWVLGVPVIVLFRAKHSAVTLSTFGNQEVDQMSPWVLLHFIFWDSVSCWSWSSPVCRDWLTSRPSILWASPEWQGLQMCTSEPSCLFVLVPGVLETKLRLSCCAGSISPTELYLSIFSIHFVRHGF